MSADGSKLAAAALDGTSIYSVGPIFVSSDYGTNWTPTQAPITNWFTVVSSADGSHLAAITSGTTLNGPMYLSSDYGGHWSQAQAPITNWFTIAISADGSRLVAGCGGFDEPGPLYFSTNSGSTWTPANAPLDGWMAAASSADGTKWIACAWSSRVYRSTDAGANWVPLPGLPTNEWQAVASSADGTRLGAAAYGGSIYTSSNSGAAWAPSANAGSNYWVSIVSSADGSRLFAPVNSGALYTSTDFGVHWTASGATNNWQAGAISADGGRLATVSLDSYIFTAQTLNAPKLGVTPTGRQAKLGWTIPSVPYRLLHKPSLTTGSWTLLTNPISLNYTNLHNEVIVGETNAQEYFRLQHP